MKRNISLTEEEKVRTPMQWKLKLKQRVNGAAIAGVLVGVSVMLFVIVIAMIAA